MVIIIANTEMYLFRYYENCTRDTEVPGKFVTKHWCPSAEFVNETNYHFMGNTSYYQGMGQCNQPYIPSTDCPDHYYPVSFIKQNIHNEHEANLFLSSDR